jgi:hypothetical protein
MDLKSQSFWFNYKKGSSFDEPLNFNLVTLPFSKRLDQASRCKYNVFLITLQMNLSDFKRIFSFQKTNVSFTDFQHLFSSQRINRYLTACNGDEKRAIKLYKANLEVAQSFHSILGVLEVILRNSLNSVLTAHFNNDQNWIINQKTGFMIDKSLTYNQKINGKPKTNDFLLKQVQSAENRLKFASVPITSGKIIAEQSFGFWTEFFEKHHYKILLGTPIAIFNNLPTGMGRKEIVNDLTKIRRFRNRIHHNEPICFNGNIIDFSTTEDVYNSIINILYWLDPKIIDFCSEFDHSKRIINSSKKI